jgi:hypothetical protein
MIREPVVSGQFYPALKLRLIKDLERFIDKKAQKKDVIAAIMPHAGYVYSGLIAGLTVSRIKPRDTVMIIGPNHSGIGRPFSVITDGIWRSPIGDVKIDSDLAKAIVEASDLIEDDYSAHLYEHSIEVEVPFFQYFKDDFKLVPMVATQGRIQLYEEVADGIVRAINKTLKQSKVLLVASSDMTHYESHESAKKKDSAAIEAMLELDVEKFLERIKRLDISMCGYAPAAITIFAAKKLGAKSAELVRYQTSAEISGDYQAVVGYAGIIIY